MTNVGCRVWDVECRVSDFGCQVSDIDRCQTSDVGSRMSDVSLMSDSRYHVLDRLSRISDGGFTCRMSHVSYCMSDVGCQTLEV